MPKTKISEFSATPANNTDIDSINIAEGCAPSGINDAIRELMSQLKDFQTGAVGDSFNGPVNGTLGATTPATASVTTLAASGAVTLSGGTANGVTYLNGSKVLTSGSALTYNGTSLTLQTGYYEAYDPTDSTSAGVGMRFYTNGGGTKTENGRLTVAQSGTGSALSRMIFQTNNGTSLAEQMTLNSTGLGIGTSSPSFSTGSGLQVNRAGTSNVRISNSTSGLATELYQTDTTTGFTIDSRGTSNFIRFLTDGSERARIDSSGNLLVGTTTASGRVTVKGATADNSGFALHLQNSSGTELGKFRNDGLFYCSGVYNNPVGGTNRAVYVDSSGYLGYLSSVRAAKTNIAEYRNNGWLYQLNPVEFNYRKRDEQGNYTEEVDGDVQYGLIADDVATINERLCFYAENENGKSLAGIDYNKLIVPMLKAIQEQQAIIEQLKARLDAANL